MPGAFKEINTRLLVLPSFDIRLPDPICIEVENIEGTDFESERCFAILEGFPRTRLIGYGKGEANAVGVLLELLEADVLALLAITRQPESERDYRGWDDDYALKISRLWGYAVQTEARKE